MITCFQNINGFVGLILVGGCFTCALCIIKWDLRSYTSSTTSQPLLSQLSKLHFTENLHVFKVFCWQDLFCDAWLRFLVVFGNKQPPTRAQFHFSASKLNNNVIIVVKKTHYIFIATFDICLIWIANKVFWTVQENKKIGFVNVTSFEMQLKMADLIGKCNCKHTFQQINVCWVWHKLAPLLFCLLLSVN